MRKALVLAGMLLALFSGFASAVTLVVNGDTPSVRWQRAADRSLVPTPAGPVILRLAPCPTADYPEGTAAGCTAFRQSPPTMWVTPKPREYAREMRVTIFHELGHIFDARYLSDADRDAFRRIWHRPALGWWEPLAPYSPGPGPLTPAGAMGEPSAAAEWFADAYQWCATHRPGDPWVRWDGIYDLRYIATTFGNREFELVDDYRRAVRSCRLITATGARFGLG